MKLAYGLGGFLYSPVLLPQKYSDSWVPTYSTLTQVSLPGTPAWLRQAIGDRFNVDPFLDILGWSFCFRAACVPVGSEVDVLHDKPRPLPYNQYFDLRHYGSTLGLVGAALKALDPGDFGLGYKDNRVVHGTTSGRITHEESTAFYTEVTPSPSIGGVEYLEYVCSGHPTATDFSGRPDFLTQGSYGHNLRDLVSVVAALKAAFDDGTDWHASNIVALSYPNYHMERRVISFEVITLEEDVVHFSYEVWSKQTRDGYSDRFMIVTHKRDFHINLHMSTIPGVGPVISATTSPHFVGGVCVLNFTQTEVLVLKKAVWDPRFYTSGSATLTTPLSGLPFVRLHDMLTADVDRVIALHKRLDAYVEDNFDLYSGSCVVSSSMAVSEFKTYINSNMLEFVSELRGIRSLIPDEIFGRFLSLIPGAGLLSGIFRFADLLANTVLLTQFGLIPFFKDLTAFAEKADTLLDRVQSLMGPQNLRGKFIFEFPDGPLVGFTLIVRTRLRVKFPPWSPIIAMLPLSAAGLEPSFSNFRDLITFSFVTDWFTNDDDKIEVGENAFQMVFAEVDSCVHSYTLYRDLDSEFYVGSGFLPLDSVSYKHYQREVSKYYPMPGNAGLAYDWLACTTGPPVTTGGALLWTLLR